MWGVNITVIDIEDDEWWAGSNEEHFSVGPLPTKKAAAEEWFAEHDADPDADDTCCVGRGTRVTFKIDGDWFIDNVKEGLAEELYEDALDNWCHGIRPEAYQDLGIRLTRVVKEWLEIHAQRTYWNLVESESWVDREGNE